MPEPSSVETKKIVGIRFRRAAQVYYFNASELALAVGDSVVVETAKGLALGRVVIAPKEAAGEELGDSLRPVVRPAQPEDMERAETTRDLEARALAKSQELVAKYQLPMTPLTAEYNLDGTHLTIYFKSEKRVDFRTLLRELSGALKTRVELRQVGARDAAKLVGGVGRCGCTLCCASHLCKFEPISMRMAREQDLPLNPANISGVCGRLLCCLAYESAQYRGMKQRMPTPGKTITTRMGRAKVTGSNPLKETVTVQLESGASVELPLQEIETRGDESQ